MLRETRDRFRPEVGCVNVGFDGEGVWGPVDGGVYVTGVETVELDNVTVDAFLAALSAGGGGENSVLKGLSCNAAFPGVFDEYMLMLRCSTLVKSVPPI